jgi:hypothetical protein
MRLWFAKWTMYRVKAVQQPPRTRRSVGPAVNIPNKISPEAARKR